MEQITKDREKEWELDWNLIQHDAVSGHGRWGNQPVIRYIAGLMG